MDLDHVMVGKVPINPASDRPTVHAVPASRFDIIGEEFTAPLGRTFVQLVDVKMSKTIVLISCPTVEDSNQLECVGF